MTWQRFYFAALINLHHRRNEVNGSNNSRFQFDWQLHTDALVIWHFNCLPFATFVWMIFIVTRTLSCEQHMIHVQPSTPSPDSKNYSDMMRLSRSSHSNSIILVSMQLTIVDCLIIFLHFWLPLASLARVLFWMKSKNISHSKPLSPLLGHMPVKWFHRAFWSWENKNMASWKCFDKPDSYHLLDSAWYECRIWL